jgi:polyphosphate glucokinase
MTDATTTGGSAVASGPATLTFDIGGTGLKATVLDSAGAAMHDRVRVPTTYPLSPTKMVDDLAALVTDLPSFARVSAGFPGVVRGGHIRTAPHFVTTKGPGSAVDDELVKAWGDFDLAGALSERLGVPARVANDADVQGAGAISGTGIELVITLGTGVGSSVFEDGHLALHLELAHHPLSKRHTYNEHLGEAARAKIGHKRWNQRVAAAVPILDSLILPDSILIGGGNAAKVDVDLGPKVRLIDNSAGLLGGIRLWDESNPLHL